MKYSVDRIENCFAVCENSNGEKLNIKLEKLPMNISEGSIIEETSEGSYIICEEETIRKREEVFNLQQSIFGRKKNLRKNTDSNQG